MLGPAKESPREFAVLRRYLTGHLSAAESPGTSDEFQLDIGLIEAVFDEDVARRRHASLHAADVECDFRSRLEKVMLVFADGCRLALRSTELPALVEALEALPALYRAFAFEGAAQGLALSDYRASRGASASRMLEFLNGPASAYPYLAHMGVGAGPVLQRWRRNEALLDALDPRYRWYAFDGYGFREGYIYRTRRIVLQEEPELPSEYAHQMFDRGIGRSLWFLHAADTARVIAAISAFSERRREAMWLGLGFVCVQTGACDAAAVRALLRASAPCPGALMEGAAFAAHARHLSGNSDKNCEEVCVAITGRSQAAVAEIVKTCLPACSQREDAISLHAEWSRQVRAKITEPQKRDF